MDPSKRARYNQGFMRRGTHSCVECRRRKIRCVYTEDDQISCITCRKTGRDCQEQSREHFPSASAGRKNKSLKDRVAKLEALLKSTGLELEKEESTAYPSDLESTDFVNSERNGRSRTVESNSTTEAGVLFREQSATASEDDDDEDYDPDPLVSLFKNKLLHSRQDRQNLKILDIYQRSIDQRAAMKRHDVLTKLRMPLVSPFLLRDILATTGAWFQGWRPLGPWPKEFGIAAQYATLQDFLLYAYNSDHPAVVGLSVLCIAESIRRLQVQTSAHAALIGQLPRPPQELFQILFERVDGLVNADSDFANTREGIDCLLMSGKLFSGMGLPRRTWITFHKVIIYGQFHGLNRALARSGETREQRFERQDAWDNLCQTDLFISMTLGLPYVVAGRNIPLSYYGPPGSGFRFRKQIMSAATLVIDRNQSGLINDVEPAEDIVKALDEAATPMSPAFWSAHERLQQLVLDPASTSIDIKRQLLEEARWQMFYWLIKLFTHLPLSIRSVEQVILRPHRLACEEASRGMLKVYNVLRNDRKSDLPNVIDYQAFISCSVLILRLLGYGESSEQGERSYQHDVDQDLVALTLQTLRSASEGTANAVAGQALEGLEDLFRLAHPVVGRSGMSQKDVRTKITIPYVGTVTIAKDQVAAQEPLMLDPLQQPPAPVFTFAHPEAYTPPDTGSHYYLPPQVTSAQCNGPSQAPIPVVMDVMNHEYTSINFDFDQLMGMNNGDWAWAADEFAPSTYLGQ